VALTILLSGRIAGRLEADRNGNPRLRYADTWLETAGAYPVSLSLPLAQRDFPPQTISAVLWGLLPDNESLLQRWGSRFHVSPRNPVALLSHVGEDCAGAVQFVNDERLESVLAGAADRIEPLTGDELAERLRRLRQDNGMARNVDDVGQFSLAGAQSKIALLRHDDGNWAIPAGRIPTTHILKPPGGDYDGFVENEMFCLRLAQVLGLPAATAEQIHSDDAGRVPGVSLPTVYATLELLEEIGIVRRVATEGGTAVYDPRTDEHHHLVCRACGAIVDVDGAVDHAALMSAARGAGFAPEQAQVVIRGLCADCRAALAAPAALSA